jgi:hypothetical protein
MNFNLDLTLALLARTPAVLNAQLLNLPDAWTDACEGPGTMSPRQVVAHLIGADLTNWMPRLKAILRHGVTQPLPPFDREAQIRDSAAAPLPTLLNEFSAIRTQRLAELGTLQLTPAELERTGTHPALGTVTAAQLLATWAAHDMTHLHQIARILAHQYRDAVGPWSRFLGVLHCNGHSAKA